jgi:hypothetical protein
MVGSTDHDGIRNAPDGTMRVDVALVQLGSQNLDAHLRANEYLIRPMLFVITTCHRTCHDVLPERAERIVQ